MTGPPEADEELTPPQRAVAERLALLRQDPPAPSGSLIRRVMRTTRWQQAVKAPLRIVAMIARSILDGLGVATRRRTPPKSR